MKFELIPRFALRRHVTVLMSLIAIMVIGFIALSQIKLEFMPKNLNFPFLMVWVPYPNGTPEETEYIIADKVEAALNTIPFRKRSFANINSNGCFVGIELRQDADMDRAYMDMVDRIERLKPELPYESQRMRVRRARDGGDSDADIFITADSLRGDEQNFIEDFVVKYFERIDGVANVDFDVAGQRNLYIYINNDLSNSYNVNLYDVIQRLRQENFTMSSGYVYEGEHKLMVRSRAKIYTLDKLRNMTINERGLKLSDIATVSYTTGEQRWAWRINGKPGMDIEISKEPLANTIQVTDQVAQVVKDLNEHPLVKERGLRFDLIFNKGDYIKQSVNNLLESGLWGGFFAFIFIYLFLRRFRMTSIITMAIPISLFISVMALYFIGRTLNGMTMMGLLLAVGLVVDNAIVIVENIYHKRREGYSIKDAAIKGTGEVGLAITLSTLTTVAIFVPILFLPDLGMGQYFKAIAIPVIAAMLASLVVAVIYIPYTSTRISSKKNIEEPQWTKTISDKLASVTMFFVKRRVDAFILFSILMAYLMFAPGPEQLGMGGGGNINDFRVMIELPTNYTFDQTFTLLKELEQKVEEKTDEYLVRSYNSRARTAWMRINVYLEPKEIPPWYGSVYKNIRAGLEYIGVPKQKLRMTREEARADFISHIPKIPGMRIRENWGDQGGMVRKDPEVMLEVEGDDTKRLLEIAHEMERRLMTLDEVNDTEINIEKGQEEIEVRLDRERMKKYNLAPERVRSVVDFNIRGVQFNNFQKPNGDRLRIYVKARPEDRERLEQLKNISVFTNDGQRVPLYSVADFYMSKAVGNIRHSNGKTVVQLKAKADSEADVRVIKDNLPVIMAGLDMPFGYKYALGRIARQTEEQSNEMMLNIFMGIILVLLLMGVLFESFILPFSVIVSVPLAFIGSKLFLWTTGTGADLMANIGYIILVGIVVNNGIVLIDAVNRNRKRGMTRNDAIEKACKDRVRPIMLTAITTISGLLPMALGETEFIGIKYAPLGRVVFGGLVTSTFLTLIFTPVFYTFFDDLREKFMKIFTSAFVKTSATQVPELGGSKRFLSE